VVTYKEFIPVNETDSQDNIISTKQVPYVVHHTVFNLDQCTKEDECTLPAFDKAQKTFEHRSKLISNKQKEFLTKLIQSKYKDKYKQETQLQKLPELTKAQANNHIKELLSK